MGRGALILSLAAAALVPLAVAPPRAPVASETFPGWPTAFEGRSLRQVALGRREEGFVGGFPGRIGRFSDGESEIIVRWVVEPTRKLHPSVDCFRGLGFTIVSADSIQDALGRRWSTFHAIKDGERPIFVRELITDAEGRWWSDVSSWYWPAVFGRAAGPWWAFTIAQSEDTDAVRRRP